MGDRIAYSQKKTWTNYVTLDPIKLLQNLFGGGDVQRDRLAVSPSASAAAPPIWRLKQQIY
jgi:hypothetical protein